MFVCVIDVYVCGGCMCYSCKLVFEYRRRLIEILTHAKARVNHFLNVLLFPFFE